MIGVFENDDLVEALAFGGSLWVCVRFGNPESTIVVKGHSDRLMDLWFTCCELHMEAFGDTHVSGRVGAGEVFFEFLASFRLSGVQADTGELFCLMVILNAITAVKLRCWNFKPDIGCANAQKSFCII